LAVIFEHARTSIDNIPSNKLAYTITEAVQLSGIGRTKLYEALTSGKLKAVKAGRRTLIFPDDLRQWLASLPAFPAKPTV
jgi:excisionase family DNA binding protein